MHQTNLPQYPSHLSAPSFAKKNPIGLGSDGIGDGNESGKTSTLHVHHAFELYISLPSLHDYDVKLPNFTSYGGREH